MKFFVCFSVEKKMNNHQRVWLKSFLAFQSTRDSSRKNKSVSLEIQQLHTVLTQIDVFSWLHKK